MRKKLINNDIKKLVSSALKGNDVIKKFELGSYNTFAIGDVIITKASGQNPVLNMTERFVGTYAELWNNDVGRILVKELRKNGANLFEIKTDLFKCILKLITDDEIEDFTEKGMNHVSYNDKWYTIIKVVSSSKDYSDKTDDYDFDYDIDIDEAPDIITIGDCNDEQEEPDSKALF